MAANRGPVQPLELSDEEREVLRECRVNSVYFRGLPLGTISVIILRTAIKSGQVPHVKRFSSFYYPGIFAFGFLSGIASYRKTCMEKIMRLENSQLADQVRSFYKKAGMTEQMTDRNITEDFESQSGFGDETQGYPSRNEGNIGKSFEMSSLPEIEDDNTKQSDRYTSYEELRRFNRNQWMQVSPRQPVNAQQPQNMKEERPALQDADDYHSSVDTYQSDISSSVWSEGSTSEQDNNIHKRQRATRPGPAPMKNAYGDVLEK